MPVDEALGVPVVPEENTTHSGCSNGTATGAICASGATASVKACQPRVAGAATAEEGERVLDRGDASRRGWTPRRSGSRRR